MTETTLPSAGAFTAAAHIATASGSRYLQQLCKHFAHKLPTTFDPASGRIDFPMGPVRLTADEAGLDLTVEAKSSDELSSLEDMVARHLVRFAFRETLDVVWRRADVAA